MSLFTDAISRLRQYNLGIYNAVSNLFGLSGVGGMAANWARALKDLATVGEEVASMADQVSAAAAQAVPAAATATQQAAIAVAAANTAASLVLVKQPSEIAGIDPVVDFLFSGPAAVPSGVITGSSGKWVRGPSGLLTYVAAGTAPVAYASTGAPLGLLVEDGRTNLLQNSSDFTASSSWGGSATATGNTDIAPDGTMTADTLSASGAGFVSRGQTVAIANDTATRVVSFFFKKTTGAVSFPGVQVQQTGGTTKVSSATLNTNTGVMTPRAGEAPTDCGAEDCGAYWRAWMSFANNGTGNVNCTAIVYPAVSQDGATWAPGLTGSVVAWGAQAETGSFPTSYIPTTSFTVDRAADVNTVALSGVIGWNGKEGTIYATGTAPPALPSGVTQVLWQIDDGTASNRLLVQRGSTGALTAYSIVSGSPVAVLSLGAVTNNAPFKVAFGWKAASFAASLNGAAAVTVSSGAIPAGLTTLRIGHDVTGNRLNSTLSRLTGFSRRIADAPLPLMSA